MNVSPVDLKHIHSSLFKKKESGISQKNKKKVKLKNIKKSILYYLISISMFCLIIVLDRIINKFITDKENFVIKALQEMLNINYSNQKPPLIYQLVASLSDIRYFVLLNTHIYIILYFGVDSFLSAKVMILHYLGLFFCYFLQILYVNPRPFWVDSGIVSYSCDGDFLLPNDFFFSYMFIFLYIFYNFRKRSKANSNENNNESFMETISENKEIYNKKNSFFHNVEEDSSDNWNESNELENEGFITKLKNNSVLLLKILIVIVFCLLVFYRYAMGVLYLESVVMSMVYCVLYFILVVFLDGYIEDFVKRSTIIASESKRNMFNWVIGIMLLQSLSFISYFSSAKYTDIKWLENYVINLELGEFYYIISIFRYDVLIKTMWRFLS